MDLRANTAADVLIGIFVDSTDGVTPETALTISQADVLLSKNGQALTQKNDATAAAHDAGGYYNCELDSTDTNTLGQLVLTVTETGALPVRHEFSVISEDAYDAKYHSGAGAIKRHGIVDSGTLQSATATTAVLRSAAAFADDELIGATLVITGGTGAGQSRIITDYAGTTDTATVDTWTTNPDATSTYAIFGTAPASTSSPIPADVVQVSGDSTAADNLEADYDGTGFAKANSTVGTVTTLTGHTAQTGDSFARLGAPAGASVSADVAAVKSETASILEDTGTTLPARLGGIEGTTFNTATDSLEAIRDRGDAAWTTGAGGSSPTVEEIRAEMDANSTQLAAIVADTNELQTDWANGGRLDLILDARASQSSVDTIAAFLDTEVAAILEDTGTTIPALIAVLNDLSEADIRTAVGLAAANLDTQLGNIPTNSELAARTLLAAAYATAANQTTIEGKIDTVDTVVDAVKLKTDSLTFTKALEVDVNIQSLNGVTLTGNGQTGTEFSV